MLIMKRTKSYTLNVKTKAFHNQLTNEYQDLLGVKPFAAAYSHLNIIVNLKK